MGLIGKIFSVLRQVKFKYLLDRSLVKCKPTGRITIAEDVKILGSRITVGEASELYIDEGCIIQNVDMNVKGTVRIGGFNLIGNHKKDDKLVIWIDNGAVTIGHHNRLNGILIVRFGGVLTIGNRNNVNDQSEIRCDDKIEIGDYNQISYKCMIWDTNTHNIYPDEKRRRLTDLHFPIFGFESDRPKTLPVAIGNDCWVGREASILKGTILKNSTVVGFKTVLSNCTIEANMTVVSKTNNAVFKRNTLTE